MFKKLTLVAAAGAGYVFGAKAGRQRYDEIVTKARELAGKPAVQNATSTVQETAAPLLDKAKGTVSDKVSSVTDKGSDKGTDKSIDLGASGTGAATRSPSAAGATASVTAPVPPVTTRP